MHDAAGAFAGGFSFPAPGPGHATTTTFGFDSAVACATDALDRLHTTAESHNRVMLLEVMGRYAGWIAIYAGMAGGADVILIPEIPFHYESVCAAVMEREKKGKHFTLIVTAEGAKPAGGDYVTSGGQQQNREARLGGISAVVAAEVEKRTGKETRVIVLGHLQRGGSPTYMDRVLCTLFGAKAVELITEGRLAGWSRITENLLKACRWPKPPAGCGRCRWTKGLSTPPARSASALATSHPVNRMNNNPSCFEPRHKQKGTLTNQGAFESRSQFTSSHPRWRPWRLWPHGTSRHACHSALVLRMDEF